MQNYQNHWAKAIYCHAIGHQITSPEVGQRETRLLRHMHVWTNQSKCGNKGWKTTGRQQRTLLSRGWRKMAKWRNAKSAKAESHLYWFASENPPLKTTSGCLPCGGELFMMRPRTGMGQQVHLYELLDTTQCSSTIPTTITLWTGPPVKYWASDGHGAWLNTSTPTLWGKSWGHQILTSQGKSWNKSHIHTSSSVDLSQTGIPAHVSILSWHKWPKNMSEMQFSMCDIWSKRPRDLLVLLVHSMQQDMAQSAHWEHPLRGQQKLCAALVSYNRWEWS